MKQKDPLANCEECHKIHEKNNKEPPCDQECKRPLILDENREAFSVWELCQDQLVMSPMGGPISIRIEAIKSAMEIRKIDEDKKEEYAEKILAFAREYFKKDE